MNWCSQECPLKEGWSCNLGKCDSKVLNQGNGKLNGIEKGYALLGSDYLEYKVENGLSFGCNTSPFTI